MTQCRSRIIVSSIVSRHRVIILFIFFTCSFLNIYIILVYLQVLLYFKVFNIYTFTWSVGHNNVTAPSLVSQPFASNSVIRRTPACQNYGQ